METNATFRRTGRPYRATSRLLSFLPSGRRRHKMTGAALRKLAWAESDALFELIQDREASRPHDDIVIKDHKYPHRRVTLHDEGTLRLYTRDHLTGVAGLREQFAERGIRNRALDACYGTPESEADLRTISTALLEMSGRLRA